MDDGGTDKSVDVEKAIPALVSGHCRGESRSVRLLLASLILCLCGRFFFPVDDPDIFWHVTIGRWILSRGKLPTTEQWNFFGLGEVFRAYSWASEVVYALLEEWFGMVGLWGLQSALALLLIGETCVVWRLFSKSRLIVGSAAIILVFVTDAFVGPRPQVVTFICFALIPILASSFLSRGVTRWNAAATAALFCAWANTHLAMILGLGYLGGLMFALRRDRAILTAKVLGIGFVGTLCTPYFGGVWLTFLSTIGHVDHFRDAIVEFEALNTSHFMFPLWLLCASLFVATLAADKKTLFGRERIFETAVTAAFLALGVYAVKFLEFSALASLTFFVRNGSPMICECLGPFLQTRCRWMGRGWGILNASQGGPICCVILSALLLLCFAADVAVRAQAGPMDRDLYSRTALDFVFEQGLPLPILTDFSNGGYLMYRLSDASGNVTHPVAIDGRTNILSPELADAYYRMEAGRDGWSSFIDSYAPGTIVWPTSRNATLVRLLRRSNTWCERLEGESEGRGYSVFVRCGGEAP